MGAICYIGLPNVTQATLVRRLSHFIGVSELNNNDKLLVELRDGLARLSEAELAKVENYIRYLKSQAAGPLDEKVTPSHQGPGCGISRLAAHAHTTKL